MSVRSLDRLFNSASVALIGVIDCAGSVGAVVLRNLRCGGICGELMLDGMTLGVARYFAAPDRLSADTRSRCAAIGTSAASATG